MLICCDLENYCLKFKVNISLRYFVSFCILMQISHKHFSVKFYYVEQDEGPQENFVLHAYCRHTVLTFTHPRSVAGMDSNQSLG